MISGERLKILARLLGLQETLVEETAESLFDLSSQSQGLATFEDFQLYYFELFQKHEQGLTGEILEHLNFSLVQRDS